MSAKFGYTKISNHC